MGSTKFGNFNEFCRDSTLPVCNILSETNNQTGPWLGCELTGIPLSNGQHLGNLGSIILCGVAIVVTAGLLLRSERKRAAVGRREMQAFLLGYLLISICEIFSVGAFPLNDNVRVAFSAIHIGAIAATTWTLFLNGIVGYQLMDDGTPLSLGLLVASSLAFLIGVGYVALDAGLSFTHYWDSSYEGTNRSYALYVLYLLLPLVWIVVYFALETVLVIRILGETRPMLFLVAAAVTFAVGQVFDFVVSPYICNGTRGAIDGALFETLFTLVSVVLVWLFWSSITEDDWPIDAAQPYP
ncbi:chitin synthase III catalytic subunit [Chaetomium sp. MPI-SDFR-AT-0129]|uniref:Chitin synthase III catalytic subunit n=1 Tax=Dichotomopilus funicola TaxID=1934379 RepID=A0AAN6V192_9PEZI|nr:chitin synthase III catalytic subunit [Chaetomium sp. MPI-SDFR-AT-0129]KAK4142997.1 chitin synthase III catalytic subunit [Dichotomopilus funicola]